MKISVIIPVYNAEKHLERAVYSALTQSEVEEIILVDDGSKDSSLQISKLFSEKDGRIKILHHEGNRNMGPSATRNLGILKSTFDWIAFLDADDFFLPNRFETACNILEDDASLDGVYESVEIEPYQNCPRGKIEVVKNSIKPEDLFLNLSPLGDSGRFHGNGFLVRKSLLEAAGLFNVDMVFGEDVLLWLKCAYLGRLKQGKTGRPVAIMTRDGNNLTNNVNVKHHLITVYKNLLIDIKGLIKRDTKILIIDKLLYSYLLLSLEDSSKLNAFLSYFWSLLDAIIKYPSFIFSRQFVLALKSFNKIVFRTNDVIP
jgi:glycosyltransferase involved in cell wall biosynthesis